MAENPDAKVNVTAVPWDAAHQKIASAIAAKQTPDVSMVGTTWQGEFAKTGALDPTPADLISKDAFFPGAWDTTVVDGTAYGVPWYVETRVIYYRKDLAAEGRHHHAAEELGRPEGDGQGACRPRRAPSGASTSSPARPAAGSR